MAEPTYDELKARLEELEKQGGGNRRSGSLEFRVGKRAVSACMALGDFQLRCITSSGTGSWKPRRNCASSSKQTRAG